MLHLTALLHPSIHTHPTPNVKPFIHYVSYDITTPRHHRIYPPSIRSPSLRNMPPQGPGSSHRSY